MRRSLSAWHVLRLDPRGLEDLHDFGVELVINLKTAKAIGLTIPKELLFCADKVME
jgi:hypothetical protein